MNFISKKFGTSLALSLGLCLAAITPAQAVVDLLVTPPLLEFDVGERNKTQSLKVVNFGDQPVKVKVSVYNWTLDANNDIQIEAPTEQSLDQWLFINPLEFTIPAQGEQTVRFGVRPKVKPEVGEHRAMIYFNSEPTEQQPGTLTIKGKLGVAAYGYVGEANRVGQLHDIAIQQNSDTVTAQFDIDSQGNSHIRLQGQYAVWPAAQFPGSETTAPIPNINNLEAREKPPGPILEAGLLPTLPVLPNTRRQIPLQLKTLPPGHYVLDVNGSLGDTPIDTGIPFVVNP